MGVLLLLGAFVACSSSPPQAVNGARSAAGASLPVPSSAPAPVVSFTPTATAGRPAPSATTAAPPAHDVAWTAPADRHAVLTPRLQALASEPPSWSGWKSKSGTLGGLPVAGPGSILRSAPDAVVVDIRMSDTDKKSVGRITGAGADVLEVSNEYRTVTASVPSLHLADVAKTDGVLNVQEVLTPFTAQTATPTPTPTSTATPTPSPTPTATPVACSPIVSEGDVQLKAALARTHHNVDGAGTTVGVVSDSFDRAANVHTHAADDVASGALPGPGDPCGHTDAVDVVSDPLPSALASDEGRAMAQIVHGLAPGADIAFASGCCSQTTFASNIDALAKDGAKVIVDDLAFFDEPVYQDGPISAEISKLKASGVTYVSAAGNNNVVVGGHDVGSYETPKYRGTYCPSGPPYVDCHNFSTSGSPNYKYGLTVGPGRSILYDLQWAQPWYGVTTDLDMYLLDDAGNVLAGSATPNVGAHGTQRPFEAIGWQNSSGSPVHVNIAVARSTGPDVRFKLFAMQTAGGAIVSVDHATSSGGDVVGPTIFGHNGSPDAITIGAMRYSSTVSPESYSSHGPVTHLFAAVTGTSAAATLPKPQVIAKPDVVASDCVRTTFFHDLVGSTYRFCGTSAAAPHAAAVAALAREKLAGVGPLDIATALVSSAADLPPSGRDDATGAGLVDADGALSVLKIGPAPSATPVPTPTTSASTKPLLVLSSEQPKAGTDVTLKGTNFPPHTLLDIFLHSTPIFLGSAPTSSTGTFSIDLLIPKTVPAGAHTIELHLASNGALVASTPVTVVSGVSAASSSGTPSRLPRTGGDIVRTVLLALFALCAGGSLVLWARFGTVKLAVESIRTYRTPATNVYAVIARGRDALPDVERVNRS